MLFFIEIQLKGQFTQNQGRCFCKEKLLLSFSNDLKTSEEIVRTSTEWGRKTHV